MLIENIILLIIILIVFYIFFLRSFLFAKERFKCKRCGKCCKLIVDLSKQDIERLKKSDIKDFLNKDGKTLKKINGYCKFQTLKAGKSSCSIYNSRPEICRAFPIKIGKILPRAQDLRCKTSDRLY